MVEVMFGLATLELETGQRLATGNALQPEDAVQYLRDPKAFCRLIKSSGALDEPRRRAALEQLMVKEKRNGL